MREQGVSEAELAARLDVSPRVVRSMLHSKRRAHVGHLERALALLGVRLEVSVKDAA
jgi:hypothetical protein